MCKDFQLVVDPFIMQCFLLLNSTTTVEMCDATKA